MSDLVVAHLGATLSCALAFSVVALLLRVPVLDPAGRDYRGSKYHPVDRWLAGIAAFSGFGLLLHHLLRFLCVSVIG
ncbi:MAG: hypothetical protein ABIS86_15160 [Streptosporangiaceae bacterium]